MNNFKYWKEVWERKGNEKTTDLKQIDGYEHTSANLEEIAQNIKETMKIQPTDRVLEIGCGAGALARFLDCNYVGIDYSQSMVSKHIELFNNSVLCCEANDIVFKNNSFDKVFSYGVFQYFPNEEYAKQVISEMKRIAKKAVFIGDLPIISHRDTHLLYKKENFAQWDIMEPDYNSSRFNVYLEL